MKGLPSHGRRGLVARIAWIAAVVVPLAAALLTSALWSNRPVRIEVSGPFGMDSKTLPLAIVSPQASSIDADVGRPWPDVRIWYPKTIGAARSSMPFPIVIYFPSWNGTAIDNPDLVREIVSRGYVVATVTYPAMHEGLSPAQWQRQRKALERPMDFSSEAAFKETVAEATRRVMLRSVDASRLIDQLERMNSSGSWSGYLDLGRIGIVGYSLGGAVAAECAATDPRVGAAVNIDGWHFGRAAADGVPRPYLLISDDTPVPTEKDLKAADPVWRYASMLSRSDYDESMLHLRSFGGIYLVISGSGHDSFNQAARPTLRELLSGRAEHKRRILRAVNFFVGDFLDSVFKHRSLDWLAAGPAKFPAARLQQWPGSAWPPARKAD
jgi:dienelactone hydrolase